MASNPAHVQLASETEEILRSGWYTTIFGHSHCIADELEECVENTRWGLMEKPLRSQDFSISDVNFNQTTSSTSKSALSLLHELARETGMSAAGQPIQSEACILNLIECAKVDMSVEQVCASAGPTGELARSSGLAQCLQKFPKFLQVDQLVSLIKPADLPPGCRPMQPAPQASNMIWTKDVPFFREEDGFLTDPVLCSVVAMAAPAPGCGQITAKHFCDRLENALRVADRLGSKTLIVSGDSTSVRISPESVGAFFSKILRGNGFKNLRELRFAGVEDAWWESFEAAQAAWQDRTETDRLVAIKNFGLHSWERMEMEEQLRVDLVDCSGGFNPERFDIVVSRLDEWEVYAKGIRDPSGGFVDHYTSFFHVNKDDWGVCWYHWGEECDETNPEHTQQSFNQKLLLVACLTILERLGRCSSPLRVAWDYVTSWDNATAKSEANALMSQLRDKIIARERAQRGRTVTVSLRSSDSGEGAIRDVEATRSIYILAFSFTSGEVPKADLHFSARNLEFPEEGRESRYHEDLRSSAGAMVLLEEIVDAVMSQLAGLNRTFRVAIGCDTGVRSRGLALMSMLDLHRLLEAREISGWRVHYDDMTQTASIAKDTRGGKKNSRKRR